MWAAQIVGMVRHGTPTMIGKQVRQGDLTRFADGNETK